MEMYPFYLGNGKGLSELEQDIVATLTKHGGKFCSQYSSHSHDNGTTIEHKSGVFEFPQEGAASFHLSSAPTIKIGEHRHKAYGAVNLLGLRRDSPRYEALDMDLSLFAMKYQKTLSGGSP